MNGKPQVMVVDDDLSMCNFLRTFLAQRGYQAVTLGSAEEAVKRYYAERPAAVILDVVMPGPMDGLEVLAAFRKIDRDVPVIVLSGQGRTTTVVQAMKLGATDFVSKPFHETDLEVPLANALKQRQLSREVASLREELQSKAKHNLLFGNSERMAEVRDLIERVADKHDVKVDVRVIAASNRDLEQMVTLGQFREDLFFRLNVVCINLPPLRERRDEIPILSDYLLKKYSVQYNKPYSELTQDTMRLFMDYDWPGNIRELENLIKRAVVLSSEEPIRK